MSRQQTPTRTQTKNDQGRSKLKWGREEVMETKKDFKNLKNMVTLCMSSAQIDE
jgi:hypothetical protein